MRTRRSCLRINNSMPAAGTSRSRCPRGVVRTSAYAPQFPADGPTSRSVFQFDRRSSVVEPSTAASLHIPTDNSSGLTWTPPGALPAGNWITGTASAGSGMPVLGFAIAGAASSASVDERHRGGGLLLSGTDAMDEPRCGGAHRRLRRAAPALMVASATESHAPRRQWRISPSKPPAHSLSRDGRPSTFASGRTTGSRLRIDGAVVIEVTGTRTLADSFGTRTLAAGRNHKLYWPLLQSAGGNKVGLSVAPSATASFSSFFKLIGTRPADRLAHRRQRRPRAFRRSNRLRATMRNVNAYCVYMRVPFEIGRFRFSGIAQRFR